MPTSRARAFLAGAAGALLVLVAVASVAPFYSDYRAMALASEMQALHLRYLQDVVSTQAIENQSLTGSGVGVSMRPGRLVKEVTVLPDGIIIAVAARFGQVFVLIPSYASGKVSWRCIAGSSREVPSACRA